MQHRYISCFISDMTRIDGYFWGFERNYDCARCVAFQIFFDDNIERTHAHIVDVRDAVTFEPLPFEESYDRRLRRVETYNAIVDPNYFINELEETLRLLIK